MYAYANRFDITYIRSAAAHERTTHAYGGPIVLTTGAVFGLSAYQGSALSLTPYNVTTGVIVGRILCKVQKATLRTPSFGFADQFLE